MHGILSKVQWNCGRFGRLLIHFEQSVIWKVNRFSNQNCNFYFTYCTGWSRNIETVFLSYELSSKEKCLKIYFGKLSLIMKLQNATEVFSVSCPWMLSDQWNDMRENTVAPHEKHTIFKRLHGFANPYFFNFFYLFWSFRDKFTDWVWKISSKILLS